MQIKNPRPCSFSVLFLPRLVLEFNLMSYAFGKLTVAMWTWCTMFLCTLTVPYFLFQRWARGYDRSSHPLVYSVFHCFLFVVFQVGVLGLGPLYVVLAYTLPPASRCIVICEQVRFRVLPSAMLCLVNNNNNYDSKNPGFFFGFLPFLWPLQRHMEVPRVGI